MMMLDNKKLVLGTLVLICVASLSGCATPVSRAEKYIADEDWLKAVLEYRAAYRKKPNDVEYKSRLQQAELRASDFYYQKGMGQMEAGNIDGAIVYFQTGLSAKPDQSKLIWAMNKALARKEAASLFDEARQAAQLGRHRNAQHLLEQSLEIEPDHPQAKKLLNEITGQLKQMEKRGLALSSRSPVTLRFRDSDMRAAFNFIADSFGINVIFDEGVKSQPVTLFARNVTFDQGLNLLLSTTKTFYKQVGPNTILVAPDTAEKRGQYEEHVIRTFHLNMVKAKDVAEIIKGMLKIKKITVNEEMNSLLVRDTREVLEQVDKLIQANDRKPAEMILDVEILEVDRDKTENLGLDLGTYRVGVSLPTGTSIMAYGDRLQQIRDNAILTLPSATFQFYKQDVGAKTLANPKVRVINAKKAKIHIGDRVPLRSSTIQDATGQVRTTFTYTDIGIQLNVEPIIHLDNSATVQLRLEVSTLGKNLGTTEDPAYSIGTRNADTFMLLRDGETAILGGLIRDEERKTRVMVPGLGDIPVIGSLFTSFNDATIRTDVLLTITPRIVRAWDIPEKSDWEFHSGTADNYSNRSAFDYLASSGVGTTTSPRIEIGGGTAAETGQATDSAALQDGRIASVPSAPLFMFSEGVYEAVDGQEFVIELIGENLAGLNNLPVEVLFNPQLLSFVRAEAGSAGVADFKAKADGEKGVLALTIDYGREGAPAGRSALSRITLRPAGPGISYLVYRAPSLTDARGQAVQAQIRASRVLVK